MLLEQSWELEGGGGGAGCREAGSPKCRRVVIKLPAIFLDVGSLELSKQAGIKM